MFPSRSSKVGRRTARLRLRRLERRDAPAQFVVTTTADAGPGSLRQAVLDANAAPGADGIVFDAAVFASPQTISLTSGQIAVSAPVTVTGPPARVTVDANKLSRIFEVAGSTAPVLTVAGLTLANGYASLLGGGAIYGSSVALDDVIIRDCETTGRGGAVLASSLTMSGCTLAGNSATGASSLGGAVSVGTSADLTRCTVVGNSAGRSGGGLAATNGSQLTVTGCTFSGNQANTVTSTYGGGGGLYLYWGKATISNSTVAGNTAAFGGGIWNGYSNVGGYTGGDLDLQNSTVAYNSATSTGGGLWRVGPSATSAVRLDSTVVAKNSAPTGPDVAAAALFRNCLLGSTATTLFLTGGGNNLLNVDPLLGALADNGGPTPTILPQPGSPCIDAGSNPAVVPYDQRGPGYPRVAGGVADVGAAETASVLPTGVAIVSAVLSPGATTQLITVTWSDTDTGIDVSSLGTGDITVTGPGGFSVAPAFVGVDVNTNGTPRVATYSFTPPGGSWDFSDNGTYAVSVAGGQVFDTDVPTPHAAAAGLLANLTAAMPVTFVVTNTDDSGPGSLRQAILDANARSGPDTIVFDPAAFATHQTIGAGKYTYYYSIYDSLTISGPAAGVTIDANRANGNFGLYTPGVNQPVTMSNLTLANGYTYSSGGSAIFMGNEALTLNNVIVRNNLAVGSARGGAVYATGAEASLNFTNCVFSDNTATIASPPYYGGGGAISGGTSVTLTRCRFTQNVSGKIGGAVAFGSDTGSLNITDCTFSDNTAGSSGGAIYCLSYSKANVTISGSIFSNNQAATGGGVMYAYGVNLTVRNSTLSGNGAGSSYGGALLLGLTELNLENSTVAFNAAGVAGGGIYNGSATVTLTSSVVAKNTAPASPDVNGQVTADNSLIGNTNGATVSGSSNVLNADPLLGPLGDHGGPTRTHSPRPGSPLLNAGSNPAGLAFDQRGPGRPRVLGGQADIGAFEGVAPFALAVSPDVTAPGGSSQTITVTFADDVAIDVGSLGTGDITVIGPGGFTAVPAFTGVDVNTNGTPRVATYSFTPPGGAWSGPDNGTYLVSMAAGQVADTDTPAANPVAGGLIVSFVVAVPVPTATAVSPDVTAPGTTQTVTVTYQDDVAIDVSTLGTGDITVTGPNGFSVTPAFVGVDVNTNGSPRVASYAFTPPGGSWDAGETGKYTVNMVGGEVFDTDAPADSVVAGPLTSFTVQLPPTKVTAVIVNGGSAQRSLVTKIAVSFTDPVTFPSGVAAAFQVRRLGSGGGLINLTLAPSGLGVTITFASGGPVGLDAGGSLRDGAYQLTVFGSKVQSGSGLLDGDGDGTPGGNYLTPTTPGSAGRLFRLFGDIDGNATVDAADFGAFRAAFGGLSERAFDFDNDWDVDAADYGAFRLRFGMTV